MSIQETLTCFKAYDIRGKLGYEMNEGIAYRIGRATAQKLRAKTVALGFDSRETSPLLANAVANGVRDAGSDVLDLGLVGVEEVYSAVLEYNADAGIEITASHNPIDFNGMKIVKNGSQPLTEEEFSEIRHLAETKNFSSCAIESSVNDIKDMARLSYLKKIMSFIDISSLKPLKIVINSGNGAAGPVIDALKKKLDDRGIKTDFIYLNHDPDPSFPNGIPNPLLEENRVSTSRAVIFEKADFGVAFDGDFDRCFLFDNYGKFVPGEYVVGLLSEVFLKKEKGATIIHDSRVVWNTTDIVNSFGGNAFVSKAGHSFVKAAMRQQCFTVERCQLITIFATLLFVS